MAGGLSLTVWSAEPVGHEGAAAGRRAAGERPGGVRQSRRLCSLTTVAKRVNASDTSARPGLGSHRCQARRPKARLPSSASGLGGSDPGGFDRLAF